MQAFAVLTLVVAQIMFPPKPRDPSAASPQPAAAAVLSPTELRFDWPEGLDVRVDTERSKEVQGGPRPRPPVSVKAFYRMRVQPHAEGLVVRSQDFDFGANPLSPSDATSLDAIVGTLAPSIIVSRAGEFLRIEDTTAVKNALDEMTRPMRQQASLPPQFSQLVQQLTSDEFLNALAASDWNSMIGNWTDFPVKDGRFEETVEEPTPIMPDVNLPMTIVMKSVEQAECTRGAARYACGTFELTSRVDQSGFEAVMKRLLGGMKELEGLRYEELDIVTVIRVKLEIGTMLPHQYSMTKTVKVRMSMPGEQPVSMTQTERRSSTFTY
jgi:hypothetical protein